MSRIVEGMRQAPQQGTLPARVRARDVRQAYPGWAESTYGVFLPKHRVGNPGGCTAYFVQHEDGSHSLRDEG